MAALAIMCSSGECPYALALVSSAINSASAMALIVMVAWPVISTNISLAPFPKSRVAVNGPGIYWPPAFSFVVPVFISRVRNRGGGKVHRLSTVDAGIVNDEDRKSVV